MYIYIYIYMYILTHTYIRSTCVFLHNITHSHTRTNTQSADIRAYYVHTPLQRFSFLITNTHMQIFLLTNTHIQIFLLISTHIQIFLLTMYIHPCRVFLYVSCKNRSSGRAASLQRVRYVYVCMYVCMAELHHYSE